MEKSLLEEIRSECSRLLGQEVAVWLFYYNKNADVLLHWDLIHPPKTFLETNPLVTDTLIPGGIGTIGFVLKRGEAECVADTFDDPRGTVAIEDTIIGNYAWCGVPIKDDKGEVISIISFFPIENLNQNRPIWSKDVAKVNETIEELITSKFHGQLRLLTYLKLEQETTQVILEQFPYEKDRTLDQNLCILLDRLRKLSYRTCIFKNILILTNDNNAEYRLSSADLIRHDFMRTRLTVLNELQWNSIFAKGNTQNIIKKYFGNDSPKKEYMTCLDDDNIFIKIFLKDRDQMTENKLGQFFQIQKDLFCKLYPTTHNTQAETKKKLEALVALFRLQYEALLFGANNVRFRERTAAFTRFVRDEFSIDNIDFLESSQETDSCLLQQVIAISLWIKMNDWKIGSIHDVDIDALKDPGTWKVLRRVISENDPSISNKYKPLIELTASTSSVYITGNAQQRRLSLGSSSYIEFDKREIEFPLDLIIHPAGYERFLFEKYKKDIAFHKQLCEELGISSIATEVPLQFGFHGNYRMLAEEGGFLIAIGPAPDRGDLQTGEYSRLVEYAQKALRLIQLQEAKKKIEEMALRSAIAAIIARNMSHNIGSHVLARLSTKDAVQAAVLNKVSGSGLALEISKEAAADDTANLNAFLRMRMDFVADVATAQKPPPPTKIYILAEVLPPFTKSGLLWDTLCASHGLKRENIGFHFKVISDTKAYLKIRAGNNKIETENDSGRVPEQIAVATIGIPNGAIGCQAFYCIIENYIRNTVKHSVRSNQQNLEVTISLYEDGEWTDNDQLMKFIIHDNWEGCRSKSGLVDDLNERLAERVIRDDGSLVASNRGLKEMKATAAYLRGLLPESVDDPDINPPLLKAVDVDGNLGHEFFVLRPKDLLVFTTGIDISENKRALLRKQGVDTLSETQTFQAKARDYPVLLITNADDGILQVLNDPINFSDLPLRIIFQRENSVTAQCGSWQLTLPLSGFQTTFDELRTSLQNGQGMAATARVWEFWTRITCQNQLPKLEIYEDKRLTQWNVESISKLVQGNDEPEGSTNVVLYARHGHSKRGNPSVKFYEPYGKGVDPISFILENPSQQEEIKKGMIYQLIDAGLAPFIIVDERVQEAAYSVKRAFPEDTNKGKTEDMAFWLSLMGVYLPPKEINLESKQLNQQQLENWLTKKGRQLVDSKLPPVLVIHQGILDVIGLQDAEKAQMWIDSHRSIFCDVIITSGRGIPDNIPPRARFIPLSTVLLYTVERKSKFHLVQSLLAARRPKR